MSATEIVTIRGREILDSRGNPTVEVEVGLAGGALGRAAVPSGASTGAREAIELRDGDRSRYLGKGVQPGGRGGQRRDVARRCSGATPASRLLLDQAMIELDGTDNKGRLGANAVLGRQPGRSPRRRRRSSGCRSTATSAAWRRASCRCR